jgi:hypothetical protein
MKKFEPCSECEVPLAISKELSWESNGVITPAGSPKSRLVFYESRIIDNLFKGVEELIGMPIEHIIIESRRREAKRFLEKRIPLDVRKEISSMVKKIDTEGLLSEEEIRMMYDNREVFAGSTRQLVNLHGHGETSYGDAWTPDMRHPWRTSYVRNPYSLPFWAAETLASVELVDDIDMWVKYEKIGEETYKADAYPAEHPIELKDWLQGKRYEFKPGNIEFERCSTCGVPMGVAHYKWHTKEGIIIDPENGRRMAAFSPFSLEAVLDDLETELGDSIPAAVIEAQRRFVKSRVWEDNWRRSGMTFTHFTALRGLGNLTEFEVDENHLDVMIENSCLSLVMVGMTKAIYELALGYDETTHEWNLTEDGDLSITVKA